MPIVGTGAFDVVNSKLDVVPGAGFNHLVCLNKVQRNRLFTEDVDAALCRRNRRRVVHRCLCWDDDNIGVLFIKHLLVVVIDGFHAESFSPRCRAPRVEFGPGDEFTICL